MNRWIVVALEGLRAVHGAKCSRCGSTDSLEFAHIQPTELKGRGRGRKERYYDVLKNPDCYTLMCKSCHKEYDDEKDHQDTGQVGPD